MRPAKCVLRDFIQTEFIVLDVIIYSFKFGKIYNTVDKEICVWYHFFSSIKKGLKYVLSHTYVRN